MGEVSAGVRDLLDDRPRQAVALLSVPVRQRIDLDERGRGRIEELVDKAHHLRCLAALETQPHLGETDFHPAGEARGLLEQRLVRRLPLALPAGAAPPRPHRVARPLQRAVPRGCVWKGGAERRCHVVAAILDEGRGRAVVLESSQLAEPRLPELFQQLLLRSVSANRP